MSRVIGSMAAAARHKDISDTLLERAEAEFQGDDLIHASEKTWGALTHCVKAAAHERGWEDGPHYVVMRNAQRLIARSPNRVENMKRLGLARPFTSTSTRTTWKRTW